ncbi:MAG: GNAT family N-acetyltransferase [Bacteroidia bacterium]|nr:GNAT family N-acetyltransferase [Bacteroidia bacterium]
MERIVIQEIKSDKLLLYREFFMAGLQSDGENFRISPDDEKKASFPTRDKHDSFTLGAFLAEELIGVISFERDGASREKLRHKGMIMRMYVSPGHRGKGVAKKLMQKVIKRSIALHTIEQINLSLNAANQRAKSLYEFFGFKTWGTEQRAIKWEGRFFEEDFMSLRLR